MKPISEAIFSMSTLTYEKARQFTDPIADAIKEGETVTIERQYKDGHVETMIITAKPSKVTYNDGHSNYFMGADIKDTYYASETRDDFFGHRLSTIGKPMNVRGMMLAQYMKMDSSKVRKIKVTYKTIR